MTRPLLERLGERIRVAEEPTACWLWTGATSQSGRRCVFYGVIREGGVNGGRVWRVNRLVLLLDRGEEHVPQAPGEGLLDWLRRADRWVTAQGWEASHECDRSLCARPDHLAWKDHLSNVRDQWTRARRRRRA